MRTLPSLALRAGLLVWIPALAAADAPEIDVEIDHARRILVQLGPGVDPSTALDPILGRFGSSIQETRRIDLLAPGLDVATLVSVTRPADAARSDQLIAALNAADSGIVHAEGDHCREWLPDEIPAGGGSRTPEGGGNAGATIQARVRAAHAGDIPADTRVLIGDPSPGVEGFLQSQSLPWDSSPGNHFRTPGSQPAWQISIPVPQIAGQDVIWEVDVRIGAGWDMTTRTRSIPGPVIAGGSTTATTTGEDIFTTHTDTVPQACSDIDHEVDPATPPQFTVVKARDGNAFQYPRPLPLQAIARDWDLVIFKCTGCGEDSASKTYKTVEDQITKIVWQLDGKGSLNDPFEDTDNRREREKEIEEKKKEIEEKSRELEELERKKADLDASRPDREKKLDEEIAAMEQELVDVEGQIREVDSHIADLERRIQDEQEQIDDANQRIDDLEGEIDDKRARIDELERKLRGEPGPEEQAKQTRLEQLEEQIEAKKREIEQLPDKQQSEEQSLRQAYDQAESDLESARRELGAVRRRAQALQDEITALENSLLANPLVRELFTRGTRMRQLGQQLQNHYLENLPASPTQKLTDLATQMVRQTNPGQRRALLDQVMAEKDRLLQSMTSGCQSLGGADASACRQGVEELRGEADGLTDSLEQAADEPPSNLTGGQMEDLDEKREELAQLETEAQSAADRVSRAEAAARRAQQAYVEGLRRLEQEAIRLQGELQALEDEATQLQLELADLRRQREIELEQNADAWLEEIAGLRSEISDLEMQILDKRSEIEAAQERKAALEQELIQARAGKEDLEERRDLVQRRLEKKRRERESLASETEEIERRIEELREALEKLREELEDLEKKQAASMTGTKIAKGPLVYYIPPPLELILQKPNRFEELKKDVGTKKALLAEAKGKKAGLQKKAFEILLGMNQELWKLKASNASLEGVDEQIEALEREKTQKEVDRSQQEQQRVGREQEEKARLEQEKREADEELTEAQQEEQSKETDLELAKEKVDRLKAEFDQAVQNVLDKLAQFEFQRDQRTRLGETISQRKATHEATLAELRDAESHLARANDALARAVAAGNETGAANLREAVAAAEADRKRIEERSRSEAAELAGDAERFRAATQAEKTAAEEKEAAEKAMNEAKRELDLARRNLRRRTDDKEKAREERLAAERQANEADQAVKDQEQKVQDTKKKIDEETDEELSDLNEKIEDKKKEKEAAQTAKNNATNALNTLSDEKSALDGKKTEADAEIQKARLELKKAEDALEAYLRDEELKMVGTFTETLTVTVSADDPLDKWRKKDSSQTKTYTIRYQKRRPNLQPEKETLKVPEKDPEGGPCLAHVRYEMDDNVEPGGLAQSAIEPQTIALWYKEGEPLYDDWPPARPSGDLLWKSAPWWSTGGKDPDSIVRNCVPGGEGDTAILVGGIGGAGEGGQADQCTAGPFKGPEEIKDWVHVEWMKMNSVTPSIAGAPPGAGGKFERDWFFEVPDVPKPMCSKPSTLDAGFLDSRLQAEDKRKTKTGRFAHVPGTWGDITQRERFEFDASDKVELAVQLFEGAHQGLRGEQIHWGEVSSDLAPEKYGFGPGGNPKEKDDTTKASGYSKVDFFLEERYGSASVPVEWRRGDNVCEPTQTIEVKRMLDLAHLFTGFAPKNGWDQARKLYKGESSDLDELAKDLPDEADKGIVFATGLLDDQSDPVDEKTIQFRAKAPDGVEMDPAEAETELYGFAWSFASKVPEEEDVTMEGEVEPDLQDYTEPASVEDTKGTAQANRFRIGVEGAYLTIETADSFTPGDVFSSAAKLVIDADAVGIPKEFKALELQAKDVKVPDSGDEAPIAEEGTVSWKAASEAQAPAFSPHGFTLKLMEIGLTAGQEGVIGGKVSIPRTDELASFSATIGPDGFLGEVSDFPEVELAKTKVEKGAAVAIDFHVEKNPPDMTPEAAACWRGTDPRTASEGGSEANQFGLLIRTGKLILPEALKGRAAEPPAFTFKDFAVTPVGVCGTIGIDYTLSAGLAGMRLSIEHVEATLRQNALVEGKFKGKAVFPEPFVGEVGVMVAATTGFESVTVKVDTDKPVLAPSLGMTFKLDTAEGSYAEEIFTFKLQGAVRSDNFDPINVNEFVIKSNGEMSADVEPNLNIQFGGGFEVHLKRFAFVKTEEESKLELNVQFQLGRVVEVEAEDVVIKSGPVIERVEIKIKGREGPVSFEAAIHYEADVLEGTLEVDVEKLFRIKGMFVMGTQQVSAEESFSYWYIELELEGGKGIPIGAPPVVTGLSLLGIGGGIGFNYDPPIGSAAGAARKTDSFAFKASVVIGNTPGGEVFKGRLTMALMSGRFSLNGKVWVLEKEDSLFGEGQLNLHWSPVGKLDGFVRMVIALADSDGKILRFSGQVDFLYAGENNWYIKSRELEGALLQRVKAEGNIEIKRGSAHLDGRMYYDVYEEVSVKVVTVKVQANLSAGASLDVRVSGGSASLSAEAHFVGQGGITVDTPIKEVNVVSGTIDADLTLTAQPGSATVRGTVEAEWDSWIYKGRMDVEVGYSI